MELLKIKWLLFIVLPNQVSILSIKRTTPFTTTAAVYEDQLYVIANSYLSAYNENKESVKGIADKLGPVVILVYKLEH